MWVRRLLVVQQILHLLITTQMISWILAQELNLPSKNSTLPLPLLLIHQWKTKEGFGAKLEKRDLFLIKVDKLLRKKKFIKEIDSLWNRCLTKKNKGYEL